MFTVGRTSLRVVLAMALALTLLTGSSLAALPGNAPDFVDVLIGFNGQVRTHLVTNLGGEIDHTFQYMPVVSARIPVHAVRALANNPDISYIEENVEYHALQTMPWGIARVNAPDCWAEGVRGTGIKVAILDTGIDGNHRDLVVYGGASFISGTTWADDHGHGTHVAGTVAALDNTVDVVGVAPEAHLYAVKVLNSNGSGTLTGIAQGIEWAITNGMDVINMSLGGSSGSSTLQQACDNAYNAGIVVVAAAGNSGNSGGTGDNIGYPAKYASVIAVGATDSNDVRAYFSSTGPALEIMAPGANVTSTKMGGGTVSYNGTSMASPHVAGVAALILSAHPTWTNVQVRNRMNETAVPIGDMDPNKYGNGLVDAYAAIGEVAPPDPSQIAVSVNTDKNQYQVGETIQISVNVKDGVGANLGGANVALTVNTPSGQNFNYNSTSGSDGMAYFSFATNESYGQGTYTISAVGSKTGYDSGSGSTTCTVADTQQLVVTVWSDRDLYDAWDIAFIYTRVRDSAGNNIGGANVHLHIRSPWGVVSEGNFTTDSQGMVVAVYYIWPWYGYGTYYVTATASKAGYDTGVGYHTFQGL